MYRWIESTVEGASQGMSHGLAYGAVSYSLTGLYALAIFSLTDDPDEHQRMILSIVAPNHLLSFLLVPFTGAAAGAIAGTAVGATLGAMRGLYRSTSPHDQPKEETTPHKQTRYYLRSSVSLG
jgi:hypothetical protein